MIFDFFDDPFYFSPSWRGNHPRSSIFEPRPFRFPSWTRNYAPGWSRPDPSPQRQRRLQSLFDDFIGDIQERFFNAFGDEFDRPLHQIDHDEREKPPQEKKEGEGSTERKTAPEQRESQEMPESKQEVQKREERRREPHFKQYFSESRSSYNGGDLFEERREKVTNSNGESRVFTLRRIGDRWYESEVVSDKDGKTTERENWHNVSDGEVEQFKEQWRNRSTHAQTSLESKPAAAGTTPPVTHSPPESGK
jgi:hypothetical protein